MPSIYLDRLSAAESVVTRDGQPSQRFQLLWQNTVGRIEEAFDELGVTTTAISAKQPLDATLTALAALNAAAGLVEQTGADTFTKRAIGVASATDILTRADGDGRYSLTAHNHASSYVAKDATAAWANSSGTVARTTFASYAGQTVSAAYTQSEVQAIDDHVKILSQRLAALINDLRGIDALT